MNLRIDYLDEHLDALPQLARWHHVEWAAITPELTIADRLAGFAERARRGTIPTGFVAVIGDDVVGLACLVAVDLESHRHLTPWLASVLVGPEHRGQGIGSALCERAAAEASALQVAALYLFTFDRQSMYARLGWSPVENANLAGRAGTIMVRMTEPRRAG